MALGEEGARPTAVDRPRRYQVADDAQFLRAQAKKCRWLAERISSGDVVETLLQMARDYDERAARRESENEGEAAPP